MTILAHARLTAHAPQAQRAGMASAQGIGMTFGGLSAAAGTDATR
jgi:hypothetical protein